MECFFINHSPSAKLQWVIAISMPTYSKISHLKVNIYNVLALVSYECLRFKSIIIKISVLKMYILLKSSEVNRNIKRQNGDVDQENNFNLN